MTAIFNHKQTADEVISLSERLSREINNSSLSPQDVWNAATPAERGAWTVHGEIVADMIKNNELLKPEVIRRKIEETLAKEPT